MPVHTCTDKTPKLGERVFLAPSAHLAGEVEVGEDSSFWFHTAARGDVNWIRIGRRTCVQDGAVLHTDPGFPLDIGADCTIGHMVMLHGCTIGRGSLIGIGSIILNGARIGEECLIGANALITEGKEIPPRSLVMGAPGKIVRTLDDAEVARFSGAAGRYVKNWRRYSAGLRAQE